ncbi:hypothetical protein SLA2020_085570 [Shorea laevis]
MHTNGYVFGHTSRQLPIHPILEGNKLHHYPVGGLNARSDWQHDPGISWSSDFIRHKNPELLASLEWRQDSSDFVTDLESKLWTMAAPKAECMNLGYLTHPLCKVFEKDLSQQVSFCPPSLNHKAIPNNSRLNCSSGTSDLSFNARADHNMAAIDHTNPFGFSKGAASMFATSNGQHTWSVCEMAQANSEMVFSPDAYCGEGFYHHEAFENGVFSGGNLLHCSEAPLNGHFQLQHLNGQRNVSLGNIQNINSMDSPPMLGVSSGLSNLYIPSSQNSSQAVHEASDVLHCEDISTPWSTFLQQSQSQMLELQQNQQWPHQQSLQSYGPCDAEAKGYVVEQNGSFRAVVAQTASEESQLSSVESLHYSKVNIEVSDVLHCMDFSAPSSTSLQQSQAQMFDMRQKDQWLHQPYLQSDSSPDAKAKCYFIEQIESSSTVLAQTASELAQLSSAESPENSRNILPLAVKHEILLAYSNYRKSVRKMTNCQDSFLKYAHSRVCNLQTCNCEHVSSLLSHFDACPRGGCDICEPVWYLSVTGKGCQEIENVKGSFVKEFSNNSSSDRCNSNGSENMLPPSKRLKMTDPSRFLSSEVVFPNIMTPLEVQSYDLMFLRRLLSPNSHVCTDSEVMGINMELLSRPVDDSSSAKEIGNNSTDTFPISASHSLPDFNEGVVSNWRLEEMDLSSDITENVLDYGHKLKFNTSPVLSEEQGTEIRNEGIVSNCEQEDMDLQSASDMEENVFDYYYWLKSKTLSGLSEKNGAGCEVEKIEVSTDFNTAILDTVSKPIEREPDCGKEMKLESSKRMSPSLIETFTAEQIKEHLSSLRLSICQSLPKKEKGNRTVNISTGNGCQLCGADRLSLAPAPLYCSSCSARIKRNVTYYTTLEENVARYCFCSTCYRHSRGNIKVCESTFSKGKLGKRKNDEEVDESWVQCDKCEGWQHQICALFNEKNNIHGEAQYVCPKCCLEGIQNGDRVPLTGSSVVGAKDLPCTALSEHIERRLFRRLKQEREETAMATGKSIDEVPEAEDLVVRVVLSVEKHLKVKTQFLDIFNEENYPAEFPYESKVILLFQKIEGVDVCLFGMYVQEFGAKCSPPNQHCVYISYLDSVKYFRPERETAAGEALRTFVYHEILMGYLEHCKERGFATCHLWACPPVKGEDYILYCHPDNQKTPKPDKLRSWYHSMLQKAIKDNTVVDLTNLYDHFLATTGQCNFKISAARLPYFDGEHWLVAAEKIIKNLEEENLGDSCGKVKKTLTKNTLKAMGHADLSGGDTKDIRLLQKLRQTIFPIKEEFIVVHLQFVCKWCHEAILSGWRWTCSQCKNFHLCERCHNKEQNLNRKHTHTLNNGEKHVLSKILVDNVPLDTEHKDVILENGLFENRHTFLGLCQENNYQFDTLRRAKHSSMMILHYLFATEPSSLAATT